MIERFDGAGAWRDLPAAARDRLGALALELAAAMALRYRAHDEGLDPRFHRLGESAELVALDHIAVEAERALGSAAFLSVSGAPLVPASLGRCCRGCGASAFDLIEDVPFAVDDLCGACAELVARVQDEAASTLPLPWPVPGALS